MSLDSVRPLSAPLALSPQARPSSLSTNTDSPANGEGLVVADMPISPTPLGAGEDIENAPASDPQAERQERLQVASLASRDREVRAHEQAHSSVGGRYAGGATYSFTRGPDGKSYATGGEVGIDLSAIAGNPQATLSKMEIVQRAALAPADPSSQDLRVAAQAQAMAAQARVELAALQREEAAQASDERRLRSEKTQEEEESPASQQFAAEASSLDLYLQLSGKQSSTPKIDLLA